MQFDDEQLIAFLLDDLPESEARLLLRQLQADSELAARLDHFRLVLGLLDETQESFEPPAGLVERTMACVMESAEVETEEPRPEGGKGASASQPVRLVQPSRLLSAGSAPSRSRRQFWDSTVLALSLSVLCCLALPALVRVRFESRKAQCASNLRETGIALLDFAMHQPDNRFPQIPEAGPASFAGVYPLQLRDHGLLSSIAQVLCPSVDPRIFGSQPENVGLLDLQGMSLEDLPAVAELASLSPDELAAWQQTVGGNYAYVLGIFDNGILRSPRSEGQSHFAILADTPILYDGHETFIAHDGKGTNMLYADGSVHFVRLPKSWSQQPGMGTLQWQYPTDDPFRNVAGEHRAGLNSQDASLAPSAMAP